MERTASAHVGLTGLPIQSMAESSPHQKASWIKLIVLGVIRDQKTRHNAMFVLLVIALLMLFCGSTFFHESLRARPFWFLLFWAACSWLTISAAMLAIYDLLVVRLQKRLADRVLRESLKERLAQIEKETGRPTGDDSDP